MTDLGTLGGKTSGAMSINAKGAVVGLSNVAPGNTQIDVFLERNGKLTDLAPSRHLSRGLNRSRSTPTESSPECQRAAMMQ